MIICNTSIANTSSDISATLSATIRVKILLDWLQNNTLLKFFQKQDPLRVVIPEINQDKKGISKDDGIQIKSNQIADQSPSPVTSIGESNAMVVTPAINHESVKNIDSAVASKMKARKSKASSSSPTTLVGRPPLPPASRPSKKIADTDKKVLQGM